VTLTVPAPSSTTGREKRAHTGAISVRPSIRAFAAQAVASGGGCMLSSGVEGTIGTF
jgi:hypothetical protein